MQGPKCNVRMDGNMKQYTPHQHSLQGYNNMDMYFHFCSHHKFIYGIYNQIRDYFYTSCDKQ